MNWQGCWLMLEEVIKRIWPPVEHLEAPHALPVLELHASPTMPTMGAIFKDSDKSNVSSSPSGWYTSLNPVKCLKTRKTLVDRDRDQPICSHPNTSVKSSLVYETCHLPIPNGLFLQFLFALCVWGPVSDCTWGTLEFANQQCSSWCI